MNESNKQYKYDSKYKMLELTRMPVDKLINQVLESEHYVEFNEFLNDGLRETFKNVIVPAVERKIEYYCNRNRNLSRVKIQLIESKPFYVKNARECIIRFHFHVSNAHISDRDPLSYRVLNEYSECDVSYLIGRIPSIDVNGLLFDRKNLVYSFNNSLEIGYGITFDGKKLNVASDIFRLSFDTSNKFITNIHKDDNSDKMFTFADFLTLFSTIDQDLREMQVPEPHKVYEGCKSIVDTLKLFSDIDSVKSIFPTLYKVEDRLETKLASNTMNKNIAGNFNYYATTRKLFNVSSIRPILNDMLSFNAALGEVVAEDILDDDGNKLMSIDDIITHERIKLLNDNRITHIYVKRPAHKINGIITGLLYSGNHRSSIFSIGQYAVNGKITRTYYDVTYETYKRLLNMATKSLEFHDVSLDFNSHKIVINDDTLELINSIQGLKGFFYKEVGKKREEFYPLCEEFICNRHYKVHNSYVYHPKDTDLEESENLTRYDLLAILSLMLKLRDKKLIDYVPNPDLGGHKRVATVKDIYCDALVNAMRSTGIINAIAYNITKNKIEPDCLGNKTNVFYHDFIRSLREKRVLQHSDLSNPVCLISSITHVNTLVKNADSVSDTMRSISMTDYGRICPFEVPASKKLGITNVTAAMTKIKDGELVSPYHKILHENSGHIIDLNNVMYLNHTSLESNIVSDIGTIKFDSDTGEIDSSVKYVTAFVPDLESMDRVTVATVKIEEVDYVTVSPNQSLSYSASTIPYIGADDGARVSFATSMFKQSVCLTNPEIPDVCTTAYFNIPSATNLYVIFAEDDGVVLLADEKALTVNYSGRQKTHYFESKIIFDSSIIMKHPVVKRGDVVKKGDILVTSNFMIDGCMATGINAFIGFISDGKNYEDGVSVSQQFADRLDSYSVNKEVINPYHYTNGKSIEQYRVIYPSPENYLSVGDIILSLKLKDSDDTTINIRSQKLFGYPIIDEMFNEFDSKSGGNVKLKAISINSLSKSDKVCNRHGNKGVSCSVSPNNSFYCLTNGMIFDILYNPCGVVSRMNIGQVLESVSALAAHVLGIRILCDPYNSPSTDMIYELLGLAYDLANSKDNDDLQIIFDKYPMYPDELKQHCRRNIGKIRYWANTFDRRGLAEVIDMKTGKKLKTRVTIGYNYIYKLVQEGGKKQHSRGGFLTSNYKTTGACPPKGASKGGGQRIGYMELDALEAHGAANLLHEMFTYTSDNPVERVRFTAKKCLKRQIEGLNDTSLRRAIEKFIVNLACLGIEVRSTNITELLIELQGYQQWFSRDKFIDLK